MAHGFVRGDEVIEKAEKRDSSHGPDAWGQDIRAIRIGPPDDCHYKSLVQTICIDLKKSLREKSITQKTKQAPAGK